MRNLIVNSRRCISRRVLLALRLVPIVPIACAPRSVAEPITVSFNRNSTTSLGAVGINEGTPDQFFADWNPDAEHPGARHLGFGHGNRVYQISYFDLDTIAATREPGKRFLVRDAAFTTSEGDILDYEGASELAPILVDWISGAAPATWNNIVGNGSGKPGHGATVQPGQRISSSTFRFPSSGAPAPAFLSMIDGWLNNDPVSQCQTPGIPNYGFLIKATADQNSSVDKHLSWSFVFTYQQVPDPACILIVNSLADPGVPNDGLTTLREAIEMANVSGGLMITFEPALAGGTIQPTSQLPTIAGGNITIDGDIDGNGIPDIEIDGSLAGVAEGLRIHSIGNVINGLVINRFERVGILLFGVEASGNTVSHCYVGTNLDGTEGRANGSVGIWMQSNTSNNRIGPGNVISGNTVDGLVIDGGAGHAVFENIIGLDASGTLALPNTVGVWVRSGVADTVIGPDNVISGIKNEAIVISDGAHGNQVTDNLIGTDRSGLLSIPNGAGINIKRGAFANSIGPGNVISGSINTGVINGNSGDPCFNNKVWGNLIGVAADGVSLLGNGGPNIMINNAATANTIGPDNVISGSSSSGVVIRGEGTSGNQILGNMIGLNATGDSGLGNRGHGVAIWDGAADNTIGGLAETDRNIISGNGTQDIWGTGITINGSASNHIIGNYIGTDLLGTIDLGNGGYGIGVENGATQNVIGPGNLVAGNGDRTFSSGNVTIVGTGSTGNQVHNNLIGPDVSGFGSIQPFGASTYAHGVLLDLGATSNTIGPGNVISGNSGDGIRIRGEGTDQNVLIGNLIGTDVVDSGALPNETGVQIDEGAQRNVVGGPGDCGNTISGNLEGVIVGDVGTDENQILGNYIGTDSSGVSPMPNQRDGVKFWNYHSGFGPGPSGTLVSGNLISWSGWDGVFLGAGIKTTITENSITFNDGRGISMAIVANGAIEPPVLTVVTDTEVSGTAGVPDGSLVEVFNDPTDEAEVFLGSAIVNAGQFVFNGSIPSTGQITATVTDTGGNTSRLSVVEGVTGRSLYAVDRDMDALFVVDTLGTAEQIGNLGIDYVRGGLAHRPGGELYLLNEGGNLYLLKKRTGAATLVGSIGYPEVEAACFGTNGVMYVAVASEIDPPDAMEDILIRLHPTSLRTTVLGGIGSDIDGLVCLPDGRLIGVDTGTDAERRLFSDFYAINASTGTGTFIGSVGELNIFGLASQDDDIIALSFPSFLLSLDLDTLETTAFGAAGGPSMITLAPTVSLPLAFGDFDGDGHTGLTDYSVFETCLSFSGPGTEPPFQECLDDFDWNDDGDVDLKDASIFQRAFAGGP